MREREEVSGTLRLLVMMWSISRGMPGREGVEGLMVAVEVSK